MEKEIKVAFIGGVALIGSALIPVLADNVLDQKSVTIIGNNNVFQIIEGNDGENIISGEIKKIDNITTSMQVESTTIFNNIQNNETEPTKELINTESGIEYTSKEATSLPADESTDRETVEIGLPILPTEEFRYDEAYKMMECINQYRADAGIGLLSWDDDLTNIAQDIAYEWAYIDANNNISISAQDFMPVARRTMGPVTTTAEVAVSAWITGNNDIPSEADNLLNANYATMGGAMYYRSDSDPFHYFWVVLLR